MARWKLIIIMVLFLIPLASAQDICQRQLSPGLSCTMLTPEISCTNNSYVIYNSSTGRIVQNESLTALNNSIFQFNFTESTGGYIVRLCDGSTREITVKGDEDKVSLAIIIGLMMFVVLFIVLIFVLENIFAKLISLMVALGFSWVLYAFMLKMSEQFLGNSSFTIILTSGYRLMVGIYMGIFILIFAFMFWKLIMLLVEVGKMKVKRRKK